MSGLPARQANLVVMMRQMLSSSKNNACFCKAAPHLTFYFSPPKFLVSVHVSIYSTCAIQHACLISIMLHCKVLSDMKRC
jgi:hypothetical protein